jgi:hypothetical protein
MGLTVGLYALAAGLLTTTLMASNPRQSSSWRVIVEVENRAQFSPAVLRKAEEWAQKVFDDIGINIVWSPPVSPMSSELRLKLVLIPQHAEKYFFRDGDKMGTAIGHDGTGARRLYISPERIRKIIPSSLHIPESFVLGCVIAHEIGHLLLPPNPHSQMGIMRPSFRVVDFDRADFRGLHFTPQQAQRIRLAIQERMNYEERD